MSPSTPALLPRNTAFSLDLPTLQFAWDSTSMGALKRCPRYYQYAIIEGWAPRAESVHLVFGLHYHSALEFYYRQQVEGVDHESAVRAVVRRTLEATWDRKLSRPWFSDHKQKNRETLLRSIVWYLDQFKHDPMTTVTLANGKPAVELTFKFTTSYTAMTGEPILWCGHLDRLVSYNDDFFTMDHKAQPLTSQVLTPEGWKQICTLQVGDQLYGKSGKPVSVQNLYPKGKTSVYTVHFNDGTSVDCAYDHLWTVATQFKPDVWRTMPMSKLMETSSNKYCVPLAAPIQHERKQFPLDPYVLGVLLGDGYLNGSSIQLSTTKEWLVESIELKIGCDLIKKSSIYNNSWNISGGNTLAGIKKLGLRGCLAADKFIPKSYFLGSVSQRTALLDGLLITDGSWNGKSRIYDSMSKQLIEDICQLVRSLGGNARYRARGDGCYRASLRMADWPSGLGHRYIKSIEKKADAETMCIEVDAQDGLYVTENYTVTHNTTTSAVDERFFQKFSPDNQFSGYIYAGKVIYNTPLKGIVVNGVQIGVNFSRFQRQIVMRHDAVLDEWYGGLGTFFKQAEDYALANYWPMNEMSCGNYGGCAFRDVCSKPPSIRPTWLKADFTRRVWDPLVAREGV